MKNDGIITEARIWAVRIKGSAMPRFARLGGTGQLSGWSFIVNIPENIEITEADLVDEVRSLGALKIYEHRKKYEIEIPLSYLQDLNNHESLEATRQ